MGENSIETDQKPAPAGRSSVELFSSDLSAEGATPTTLILDGPPAVRALWVFFVALVATGIVWFAPQAAKWWVVLGALAFESVHLAVQLVAAERSDRELVPWTWAVGMFARGFGTIVLVAWDYFFLAAVIQLFMAALAPQMAVLVNHRRKKLAKYAQLGVDAHIEKKQTATAPQASWVPPEWAQFLDATVDVEGGEKQTPRRAERVREEVRELREVLHRSVHEFVS